MGYTINAQVTSQAAQNHIIIALNRGKQAFQPGAVNTRPFRGSHFSTENKQVGFQPFAYFQHRPDS
jgi:hypothetical protein